MLLLTKEELKLHQEARNCYIYEKGILQNFAQNKNYRKLRDHSQYTGSNYGYHFIIKELTNEFGRKFECLGENTEKYKTFSVPIEKEVIKVDKDGNESVITISYKIKFIDSARVVATLLSNLVLVISLKEFTKLNVKIVIVFLNTKVSMTIQ